MSDVEYMNTYVNVALETVHSYVNDTLQLKTQIKVLNDLVQHKEQTIQNLSDQLQSLNTENENRISNEDELQNEIQKLRDSASSWEIEYHNIINKVSHMDTLTNQYNELKGQYIQKENDLNNINNELSRIMNEFKTKQSECEGLKQTVESLRNELSSTKSKLDKIVKKEEKKVTISPVESSSKKVINKESSNAISIPRKIVDIPQEIDDF